MQRHNNFEKRDYRTLYSPKGNKFVIGTVTGKALEITAQYNPKELARTASAAWHPHPNTSARQSKAGDSLVAMEYGTSEPRSVVLELLFDGYEEGFPISGLVDDLESLTLPLDRQSLTPENRHPQLCVAVWGSQLLRCIVVSVTTKLTMFDSSGEPLRATCSVTLKEVDVVAMMKQEHATGYDTRVADLQKKTGPEKHKWRSHWADDRPTVDASQRANLRGTNAPTSSSSEPAWTPPPPKATPAQPVVATHVDGIEDGHDQYLADDQDIQAQNEQDRKAGDAEDLARAADAPKPTETVTGTNEMPGGTYEVGAPREAADPTAIESSDPPKPTETVAGTNEMPGGTYEVGAPSEKVDPNTIVSNEPASHPLNPEILGELE